uniref:IRS-type PTB domain-containing protein n=1 Tax=Steinernema glaseri TaxID=37863 RepID=A0A1I7ZML9_9BILA
MFGKPDKDCEQDRVRLCLKMQETDRWLVLSRNGILSETQKVEFSARWKGDHAGLSYSLKTQKRVKVSLMENDVNLFREMLTIADTLQELKMSREAAEKSATAARSNSQSSLTDEDEEEDDLYICDGGRPFSSSMPGITRLYVDDEPKPSANVQFFSRKNSVLRIPIPPRSSNRMNSTRRIPRRPSELLTRPPRLLHIDDSTSSASQSPQQSPQSDPGQKSRRSSGSIDSGIRDGEDSACSLSSSDSLPSRHRDKLV